MKKRIIFRLPNKMYQKINEAVTQGKFETVSELVRIALSDFLPKLEAEENEDHERRISHACKREEISPSLPTNETKRTHTYLPTYVPNEIVSNETEGKREGSS